MSFGGGITPGAATPHLSELASLRAIAKCSVCSGSNMKECTLVRCGHTFCRKCIDERVSSRNRKCPSCGQTFAVDDVKAIFFA
jgi:E3 ubiquitin-protein ligase BRE1